MYNKENYIEKYGEKDGITLYELAVQIDTTYKYIHRNDERNINVPLTPKEEPVFVSPYAMDLQAALVLYIIVMFVGVIFVDRWFIWLAATVIYIRYNNQWKKK